MMKLPAPPPSLPEDVTYIGYCFQGKKADILRWNEWSVTCPCGVEDRRPINKFPLEDSPHKCGKPNHWFAKYVE